MMSSPLFTSFLLVVCILLLLPHIQASSAPWQSAAGSNSNNNKNAEEDFYKNLPPTVFSGNGRLYSVERMAEAASNPDDASSNVAVAICYDGGVVVVSSSTKSPHLDDDNCTIAISKNTAVQVGTSNSTTISSNATNSNTTYFPLLIPVTTNPLYQVGPNVYATTSGNAADSQLLRDQILQISSMLWESRTGSATATFVPPSLLARHVADHLQRPTQQMSSGKILASQALVWDSSSIWRVDPSGQFWKCRAAAIGRSRPKVEALLVKGLSPPNITTDMINTTAAAVAMTTEQDEDRVLTQDEAIQLAVESVQSVVPKERRLFGLVVTAGNKRILTHETLTPTALTTSVKH